MNNTNINLNKVDKVNKVEEKTFDSLCLKDKNGKIRNWNIKVINYGDYSEIITLHGYIRQIETCLKVTKGKNIGKKNETTHFQQAISQALSKWKKKIELEGYSVSKNMDFMVDQKNTDKENEKLKEEIKRPMLALEYTKNKNKVTFPTFIQPKLDGYRMVYNSKTNLITSRTGKDSFDIIKKTDKLYNELQSLKKYGYIFDGELYVHGLDDSFEKLGILRKKLTGKKVSKEEQYINKIEYHIYDIVEENKIFKERNDIIRNIFKENKFEKIKYVETVQIQNEIELEQWHTCFVVQQGYEGSIIRNENGRYKCKFRSSDLLKYKDFIDAEYTIVNYTFESNVSNENNEPLILWVCQTPEKKLFNVRPQGTVEERKYLYEHGQEFIGKKLWVKYFGLTEFNIPRFPTTKTKSYKDYIREEIL